MLPSHTRLGVWIAQISFAARSCMRWRHAGASSNVAQPFDRPARHTMESPKRQQHIATEALGVSNLAGHLRIWFSSPGKHVDDSHADLVALRYNESMVYCMQHLSSSATALLMYSNFPAKLTFNHPSAPSPRNIKSRVWTHKASRD